jgi:hypothetical protein
MPISWDDRKLREKFCSAGRIDSVEIKAKGNGLIRYSTNDQAKKAVG